MNKALLTTILAVVGFLLIALLTSVIYVTSESKREGINYFNTRMKHVYADNASAEEIYAFLDEAVQAALDDHDYYTANAILTNMQTLASKKSATDQTYFDLLTRRGEINLYKIEDVDAALPIYKQAMTLAASLPAMPPTKRLPCKIDYGNAQAKNKESAAAQATLKDAYKEAQAANLPLLSGLAAHYLANLYREQDDYLSALANEQLSVKSYESDIHADKTKLAQSYQQLGYCQHKLHQDNEALVSIEKAMAKYREDGVKDVDIIDSLKESGWIELDCGHKEKAKDLFNRAITAGSEASSSHDVSAESFILRRL